MQVSKIKYPYQGRIIVKNTLYNLLGYGIPLLFALFLIPPLITELGTEKFGILTISWMMIGYFSFFDFGIGKGLTKVISEKIGLNKVEEIPGLFWTSLSVMLIISGLIILCSWFFIPSLVNIFKISKNLHQEVVNTFYVLILSIPIVSTTAGLRGVLEAYQKFSITNVIRIILGIFTFLVPLLVLIFTSSLFWIVNFLVLVRIVIWVLYLFQCFKINTALKEKFIFNLTFLKPVWKFSIWITLANVVGPIILYSDRFLIGSLISASAITYYSTPYEVVTKLLLLPGALTGVLFPIFSANFLSNPEATKRILLRGIKFVFLIIYPVVFLIILFAFDAMNVWLGVEFAINSSFVLQFLSLGILMNCLSAIPNNFFQGIGKPKIPTLINLGELPVYIAFMWIAIKTNGIKGAAVAYFIAASIDVFIMYFILNKKNQIKFESRSSVFIFLFLIVILIIPFFITNIFGKVIFAYLFLLFFVAVVWKFSLSIDEKYILISRFKLIFK
jgi:O-antigen/teichoic acid export membrane protein